MRGILPFLIALGLPSLALGAAPPIGETKAIVPAVRSVGENGNVTLSLGSSVYPNDLVRTEVDGKAGLVFLDNTTLEVGPNSSVKLDKFVYNPDSTAAEATISASKGLF